MGLGLKICVDVHALQSGGLSGVVSLVPRPGGDNNVVEVVTTTAGLEVLLVVIVCARWAGYAGAQGALDTADGVVKVVCPFAIDVASRLLSLRAERYAGLTKPPSQPISSVAIPHPTLLEIV